ncbi:putative Late nodulin [Medicago truncatula]|uniref:Putative Late nodulin n=1 Tax=Medicago truncatula TaxID=3880 RepID=A0A396J014_MEDTR|nr:putative Late nodulin [Medicago truncatula]
MLKNMAQILKFIYVLIISISLFSVTSAGRRPFNPFNCQTIIDCKYKACHRPLTRKCIDEKCVCM